MNNLQKACNDLHINIMSTHMCVDYNQSENYYSDKWSCNIYYNGRSENFIFFSGIGHRKLAKGIKREGSKYVNTYTGDVVKNDQEAINRNFLILTRKDGEIVGPNVADVLYCLFSDAEACDIPFDEWCRNLGYNNDSLKALNTYIECQRNGTRLYRLLGAALVAELREKCY